MYKALYRQYRPVTFDDVFGQDIIVQTLKNSIINKSYSHAYMFFGPRGTGKTSISKIFARSLNCLNPVNGNSCGICDNCKNSYDKECVDIIEIDAASNNGVDEIRELRNKISLVPAELKYKVYIIDEVHMLSIGAFNALLKTLEEPPEHVIFILATTDPQKVPETIISRCQCFSFKRISTDKIVENLKNICLAEKIDINDDVIEEIAYSSNGGMRDALSSLDQLRSFSTNKITLEDFAQVNGVLTNAEVDEFFSKIFERNYHEVLSKIKLYNEQGKNLISILEKLMRSMRDKIVKFYINNEKVDFSISDIQKFVFLINEKMSEIKKCSNPIIYIEMLLLKFMDDLKVDSKQIIIDESSSTSSKTSKNGLINENETPLKPNNINVSKENIEEKNIGEKSPNNIVDESKKLNLTDSKDLDNNKNEDDYTLFNSSEKIIENIDEIISARVNNTLATANKKLLINEINNLSVFNDYTFDQDIGFVACALLDCKIRAVSENFMIISFEYDSIVKQNLLLLDKINDVYNKISNSNKKIAIISDSKWEEVKNKYIDDLKNGISYNLVDEPAPIFKESKNNDIISNNAIELFGDIVEIK